VCREIASVDIVFSSDEERAMVNAFRAAFPSLHYITLISI